MRTVIRWSFLIFCLCFCGNVFSQNVHHFTKGLMVNSGGRYGREAIYTDLLAWQLYNNSLKKPVENGIFGITGNGDTLTWRSISADSANRFRTMRWIATPQGNTFGNPGRVDRGTGYVYLTYHSSSERAAILNIKGNSSVYFNGVPHAGDPYSSGWLYIPVKLKKGLNELYVRGTNITADLIFPSKPVGFNTEDPTLPSIVLSEQNNVLKGAIVVMNTTANALKDFQIKTELGGKTLIVSVPVVPAMSTRKIPFDFDASAITQKGAHSCTVTLINKGKPVDETKINIDAVEPSEKYSNTFISNIDGSLQYYAVAPQLPFTSKSNNALFLSVHGAGVEAIGQARAYQSKDWGTLVAATNRRPRGFNWEDWGRLDALEVLEIAKNKFNPDPQRIYLTGHSMGGHGTWFLGATYPDKWAAIAPAAGYPTLKGYGSADGLIPDSSNSSIEQMLLRSSNQSDVIQLAKNYSPLGVYILHGDADRVVPVSYARQMRKILGDFHSDFNYYEYPNGEHWFGDQSVDWKPLFDFFKWHQLQESSLIDTINFTTANPGISASYHWATIAQQTQPLLYSKIQFKRNKKDLAIKGITENVRLLKLNLQDFGTNATVQFSLDNQALQYTTKSSNDSLFLIKENEKWAIAAPPSLKEKGPHRYGTFKDAFNHQMIFVYSTNGTKEENEWSYNKARYDAETWYYRGNGAVDIIADKDFNPDAYVNRGVILYGNAGTNSAWDVLLKDCPIQVQRNSVTAGNKVWNGDDISAYFVWPLHNSNIASVGVVSGTGLKGMNAANANQYFAGASGFPDFMIYSLDMLKNGSEGIKMAGFFNNNWQLSESDLIANK